MNSNYHFPDGHSMFRTLTGSFKLLKDPIGEISIKMEKFYGTYSANVPGKGKMIVTQDSDFINYVLRENHTNYQKAKLFTAVAAKQLGNSLLFLNGDTWRSQRRLIQPAFHQSNIQQLYETVINTINAFITSMPQGEQIDVYPLMRELSFSVLVNSLFTIDMSSRMTDELCQASIDLQAFMLKDVNQPFKRFLYPFTGEERKIVQQCDSVRNMLKDIIAQRRAAGTAHNDLLDILLNSRYEDTGQGMSEEQLINELIILLFAGHETTGSTIAWLLYLIASDQKVLEKLKGTIEKINILDSPRDSYINAIINEGMRLYPAAWIGERVAIKDDQFGGFSFPGGTSVYTYFYGMHRYPGYWNDASKFDPERFLTPEGSINKNVKNFLPFGAGPRMCIGNNFAMAEIAFVLYSIFKAFQIRPTPSIPAAWAMLTLRPHDVVLNINRYD